MKRKINFTGRDISVISRTENQRGSTKLIRSLRKLVEIRSQMKLVEIRSRMKLVEIRSQMKLGYNTVKNVTFQVRLQMSRDVRKPVFAVSDQV